ncbi:uncharacterized protein SI:CH211-250N8.1 isoform X2 [Latimeria chalumnae]|uniref:uncharacterized protein SI:CH211-250N8.1 isoform X2 n=1 Tax=Latimeria chalumnae TaxID=7897 RepID=UPI0003C1A9FB|nr:PREDICTED: uncharacterized protein LOC102353477 isoform X2 [Latimeria chalumnae]|eukprot:XP_006001745.1 PREDICTED: uncharacterized protein LOC102353477 isoform X2 [Latimeria chalumnae]
MSSKDPLLGTLKACILNIQREDGPVTDQNPHLSSFCEILEIILRKGMKQPVLSLKGRDYWNWMEQLSHQDFCGRLTQLCRALEKVASCKKVLTAQGRGRFMLRLALNMRILSSVITHLTHTPKLMQWYDPAISVFGNEALMVVSEMNFALDLENSSFLDESWLLPLHETYEIVPCRELGITLRYLDGRVFVLELIPGGQADVDEVVLLGDIIDEINGVSLRNAGNGEAGTVLQKFKGKPLNFRLIRWKWHDGTVYKPMVMHLKLLQQEYPNFQLNYDRKCREKNDSACLQDGRVLYGLRYLGQTNVGMFGGKEILDQGILTVLEQQISPKDVLLDVKETELLCTEKTSSQVLFHYPYPEISCVGRRVGKNNTVFAFCASDSPDAPEHCTFNCLVLKANSEKECDEIIKRIAIGFKHTEWFV